LDPVSSLTGAYYETSGSKGNKKKKKKKKRKRRDWGGGKEISCLTSTVFVWVNDMWEVE
jgi:hypothetical protein